MHKVDEIIDRAGGPERIIEALGITRSALRKWRQNAAVPGIRQLALIRMSGGKLSLDDFDDQRGGRLREGGA